MSELKKKKWEGLFRLIQEHPELPVVPMVDSDIVADDGYAWWLGSWGMAELGAYVIGDDRVYFRDDDSDEMENALNHTVGGRDWYKDATEAEVKEAYQNLPWTEAIIVYIVPPAPTPWEK